MSSVFGVPGVALARSLAAGTCVTDGADAHGNSERCRIAVRHTGNLTATEFDTEVVWDYVTIGGTDYSGTIGPVDVPVEADDVFTWFSDGSITNEGWTICLTASKPLPRRPLASI